MQVKIIDFGLSKKLIDLNNTPNLGTDLHRAPEVEEGNYEHRVDVWGLGLIFYCLLNGALMFSNDIQERWGKWYINKYANYSIEALRFIHETVLHNKELRLEAEQLQEHDYFRCDLTA